VLNFDDGRHRPIAVRDLSWLETSPEWRGLRAWLVRKEGWLPVGSWRRRIFDHAVRSLADLASAFMRAPKRMSARRDPRDGIRDGARTPQAPTERPALGAGIDLAYRAYLRRVEPKAEKVWNAWTPRSGPPRISIVSAFGETSSHHFLRSAASLSAQLDPEWSWSVVVSGEEQRRRLQEAVAGESRCSVVTGEPGVGPIGHLNLALGNATADLVMQLDPGVMLAPWALTALAGAAEEDPRADWVYADHDHLDEFGRRLDPVFKPEMSPEGMLTINYLEPVSLFRRSILTRVGMLDPSLGSAAIWSLGLKAFQAGFRFRRVPQVLSHLPHGLDHRTTAAPDRARWRADRRKAIGAHLRASGAPSRLAGAHADGAATPRGTLRGSRSVSIIIPSKDQAAVLANCLEGTLRRTKYPRLDVCVVDTGSREPQTESLYETFRSDPAFSVIRLEPPFNFGRACNNGAAHVSGELLLFLNNDTEVLDPFWLSIMAGWFDLAGVGAVGAKLLYPDGRIQHGGVVVGMGGLASHLFQWMEEGTDSLFGTAERVRNVSAVTGACMLVSRAAFQAVGGFDEEFQLNYSDVDLCLRLRHAGFRIVYEPRARLIHHESLSHRRRIPRRDFELATERWAARGDLEGDPYYNPNLSYMSACPAFNLGPGDNPGALNRRLMRRMPRKQVLTLPDDLR
jgi:GT2 family glycosyltransferase